MANFPSEKNLEEIRDRINKGTASKPFPKETQPIDHGKNISEVEVTNISSHGLWLYVHGEKLFMSYENFPWFKEKTLKAVLNVKEVSPGHYYWPEIDIDLTKEIIQNPDKFPLKAPE